LITRAAVSLGLVWLALPQHPDLGLPVAADSCAGQLCVTGYAAESERETILQRLREVRNEIRINGRGLVATSSGDSGEVAPQNADGLRRLMARLKPSAVMSAGERR
jgi:hypothetical protein